MPKAAAACADVPDGPASAEVDCPARTDRGAVPVEQDGAGAGPPAPLALYANGMA